MKTAVSGLLMSELAHSNGEPIPPNGSPNGSPIPFLPFSPSSNSYYPQQQSGQPVIVVQPPAQQIYFNGPYGSGSSRSIRSSNQGLYYFTEKWKKIVSLY